MPEPAKLDLDRLRALHRAKCTDMEIAVAMGVAESTVANYRRRLGLVTWTRRGRSGVRKPEAPPKEPTPPRPVNQYDDRPTPVSDELIEALVELDAGRRGPLGLRQVGALMGCSCERVRQIEQRAIKRLQEAARKAGLSWEELAPLFGAGGSRLDDRLPELDAVADYMAGAW